MEEHGKSLDWAREATGFPNVNTLQSEHILRCPQGLLLVCDFLVVGQLGFGADGICLLFIKGVKGAVAIMKVVKGQIFGLFQETGFGYQGFLLRVLFVSENTERL